MSQVKCAVTIHASTGRALLWCAQCGPYGVACNKPTGIMLARAHLVSAHGAEGKFTERKTA